MADEEQKEPIVTALASTVISTVTWNPDNSCDIQFNDGTVVSYASLPRNVYETLLTHPSAGTYFNQNIRRKYA